MASRQLARHRWDAERQPETSVLLADDHAVVRSGLRLLLDAEPDLKVIGEASDVPGTIDAVARRRPAVLVLDLNMPGGGALEALPDLRSASPGTAVVILTIEDDPTVARQALRAGALGYVLKEAADSQLIDAVRAAAAGERYLNPKLGGLLVGAAEEEGGGSLSQRDRELLRLVALGHTNREVAERLYVSVRTVEVDRARLQRELGLHSRPELVRFALEHRLLTS